MWHTKHSHEITKNICSSAWKLSNSSAASSTQCYFSPNFLSGRNAFLFIFIFSGLAIIAMVFMIFACRSAGRLNARVFSSFHPLFAVLMKVGMFLRALMAKSLCRLLDKLFFADFTVPPPRPVQEGLGENTIWLYPEGVVLGGRLLREVFWGRHLHKKDAHVWFGVGVLL